MADLVSTLLNNLKPKPSSTVGVSLSQSGLLEVCICDKTTHIVKKYANRHIQYNLQTREIESIDEFKANIVAMYQELAIPANCTVALSLPSVFFDLKSVPLILDTEATESVLLGEIEQSYIFKKIEPTMSWREIGSNAKKDNKIIAYAAMQKDVAELFIQAFDDIGSKLIAIDNSYFNLLNTIPLMQMAKDEVEKQAPWNIVLVSSNSYVIFSMVGDKLLEYFEEPLALRSISEAESIIGTLCESINSSLQNYMANSILVISDSDEVNASILAEKLNFHGQKKYLNQNTFATGQVTETSTNILPDYISSISLYAVGSAIYNFLDETKVVNLIEKAKTVKDSTSYMLTIGAIEVEVTKETVQAFAILVALIIGAFYVAIFLGIQHFNNKLETQIADLDTKTTSITTEIKTIKDSQQEDAPTTFDLTTAKADVVEKNKQAILYYNLLSFNIPKSTWITRFYTNSDGAVLMAGKTSSTNNVYMFFKGIKASMDDSDLALTKLKYAVGFEDEIAYTNRVLYEFELSNAQYATSAADITPQTVSSNNENLDATKQEIQNKVDSETKDTSKTSKKDKTPDLPPIEDIKTNDDTSKTTKKVDNQKITKDDVEEVQAKKATKTSNTKEETSPELPDLPDLEN